MDNRTSESQMDFEYLNKTGPVDLNSPWLQHTMPSRTLATDTLAKKRLFSECCSPGRKGSLSSTFSGDSSSKFKPTTANFLPTTPKDHAWAPRHIDTEYVSSGPENNSSPENNADSEATPDFMSPKLLAGSKSSSIAAFSGNKTMKPTFSFRPTVGLGKGGLAKARTDGVMKRLRQDRRRDNERKLARRRDSSASDFEIEKDKPNQTDQSRHRMSYESGIIARLFHLIESYPHVPHILSWYAQLLLNVSLIGSALFLFYNFWATVRSDVDKQSEEALVNTLAEIAKCARDYHENRCEKESRAPALEMACDNWERCKNRDAKSISRAKISAHAFAEIYNSFIEPLSYKTMTFTLVFVAGLVVSANLALGFTRSRGQQFQSQYNHVYPTQSKAPYSHPDGSAGLSWDLYKPVGSEVKRTDSAEVATLKTPVRRLQYGEHIVS